MSKVKDVTGKVFSRLTVLSFIGTNNHSKAVWQCLCECGNRINVIGAHLQSGNTRSCGCLELELKTKHGMWNSPEYRAWQDMKDRCSNSGNEFFPDYGGRGISVHPDWLNSFENFFAHIGARPDAEHSLDRIEVDGDYVPGNVRWAHKFLQQTNRRNNRLINTQWGLLAVTEACRRANLTKETVMGRIRLGWPEGKLLIPVKTVA